MVAEASFELFGSLDIAIAAVFRDLNSVAAFEFAVATLEIRLELHEAILRKPVFDRCEKGRSSWQARKPFSVDEALSAVYSFLLSGEVNVAARKRRETNTQGLPATGSAHNEIERITLFDCCRGKVQPCNFAGYYKSTSGWLQAETFRFALRLLPSNPSLQTPSHVLREIVYFM